jgi:hypothetical protein
MLSVRLCNKERKVESEKAIKLSIANVLKEGLDDVFERPFEVDLLKNKKFREKVFALLKSALNGNSFESLSVNRISHVLLPKNSAFDFRRCALIQPLDLLKYNSLVLTIADDIEKNRIPVSENRIFSYRFKPEKGFLFNRYRHMTAFQKSIREKAKRKRVKFVVSCDISNFYDRLNIHRLENSLLSFGCDKNKVKTINELLLFWANRDSYGLPVGSNGSRILAEASLIGVDRYLREMKVDFIRFVDDYRLFAPDTTTAHYWLTILIERLWIEGLNINKSKTKIEASSEYKKSRILTEKDKRKEEKRRNPFKIIAGYGGTVPTRFRELTEKEAEAYKLKNIDELIEGIVKNDFIEAEQIIELIKTIVANAERFKYIAATITALDKYPQLTPYVVDALIKNAEKIPAKIHGQVRDLFSTKLDSGQYTPEYLVLAFIRILGNKNYYNKKALLKYFRELRRNSGAYIGRATLEGLETHLTREETIEIRRSFDRSDLWEKRQIIRLVDKYLNEEEKRPWLKNLRFIENSDCFLQEAALPTKSELPKKKSAKKGKPA